MPLRPACDVPWAQARRERLALNCAVVTRVIGMRRFEIAGQGSGARVPFVKLFRGFGALAATACAVAAIAAIGIVATAVTVVLLPLVSLAVWGLGAFPVQGMERTRSR